MTKKPKSVATILERELEPTIKEWLRRVNLLPALTHTPLNDEDRVVHLPNLFHDLACRLRLPKDAHLPMSTAATAHRARGRDRGLTLPPCSSRSQGCSRWSHSKTLHRHQGELDQDQVLLDVMVIADEVDLQLMQAVRCWD